MNPASIDLPPARVTPNLGHAFGGIWRLTLRRHFTPGHLIALAGTLVILPIFSIPSAPNREAAALGFLRWFIDFYLAFLVPIFAYIMAGGALRDELKPESVDYIFTRPVPRPAYIFAKFLSQLACIQLNGLLTFAVLLGVGVYRQVPDLFDPVPQLLFAQVLLITVFSAFGFFFGLLTSRFVVIGLIYGAVIEIGVGKIPTQLNRLSMTHQVKAMFPSILQPPTAVLPPAAGVFSTGLLLLGVAAVLLTATAAIFKLKELAGAQGREA